MRLSLTGPPELVTHQQTRKLQGVKDAAKGDAVACRMQERQDTGLSGRLWFLTLAVCLAQHLCQSRTAGALAQGQTSAELLHLHHLWLALNGAKSEP